MKAFDKIITSVSAPSTKSLWFNPEDNNLKIFNNGAWNNVSDTNLIHLNKKFAHHKQMFISIPKGTKFDEVKLFKYGKTKNGTGSDDTYVTKHWHEIVEMCPNAIKKPIFQLTAQFSPSLSDSKYDVYEILFVVNGDTVSLGDGINSTALTPFVSNNYPADEYVPVPYKDIFKRGIFAVVLYKDNKQISNFATFEPRFANDLNRNIIAN